MLEETARLKEGGFTLDEDKTSKILSSISLSCTHRNTTTKISFNIVFCPYATLLTTFHPLEARSTFALNVYIHYLKLAYFILWLNAIKVSYLLTKTTTERTKTLLGRRFETEALAISGDK